MISNLMWRRASSFTWAPNVSIDCKTEAGLSIVSRPLQIILFLSFPLTLSLFLVVTSFFGTFGAEFGGIRGTVRSFSTEPITLGRFSRSLSTNYKTERHYTYATVCKGFMHSHLCIWQKLWRDTLFLSVHAFPRNWTHGLGVSHTMLYFLSYRKMQKSCISYPV